MYKYSFLHQLLTLTAICFFLFTGKYLFAQQIALSESDRQYLITEINQIAEKDQRYRTYIALGTLNDSILQENKIKSNTLELQDYLRYRQTIKSELSKEVKDALWTLQHQLDKDNYNQFIQIVQQYGYPSKQRLGVEVDDLFVILLHPPAHLEVTEYLEKTSQLLLPEVKAERMEAKLFATFYDNMRAKILKEPQLYGTNQPFDPKTMSIGLPDIANIAETNRARVEIGLPELQEGEYQIRK